MKYSNKKQKQKRDTFPCKTCITYIICFQERDDPFPKIVKCPIFDTWWKNYQYPEQRWHIYDKFFPPKPSVEEKYNYE
jgi:hypothetical protein